MDEISELEARIRRYEDKLDSSKGIFLKKEHVVFIRERIDEMKYRLENLKKVQR